MPKKKIFQMHLEHTRN